MDEASEGCQPVASWSLTFEAGGDILHCPMVEAVIGGCATRLIVDTGATDHVLTLEFVERAGLPREAAPAGRDAAGEAVPSWAVGRAVATIAGSQVVLDDVVAIEGPPPFESWGVGGFLSPQALASTTTAVLDLAANTLHYFAGEATDVLADVITRFNGCRVVQGTRHSAGTLGVEILPGGSTRTIVAIFDSGAAGTELAAGAFAHEISGARQEAGKGVGGSPIVAELLRDQKLEVGGAQLVVPALSIRDVIPSAEEAEPAEVPEGLVGMDLLNGTALVIAPSARGDVWWCVTAEEP